MMNIGEFKEICKLTFCLTELKKRDVPHLAIENFAPELLRKLMHEYNEANRNIQVESVAKD